MWYVPYYFIKISKNIVQLLSEISELKARLFQLVLVGFAVALPTLRSLASRTHPKLALFPRLQLFHCSQTIFVDGFSVAGGSMLPIFSDHGHIALR